ncbi:MAG TPA: hypothetical protein VF756_27210 [Thermoanaerobaculia bacterium]
MIGRLRSGKASRAEVREAVRHLLAGCRECAAAVRPLWGGLEKKACLR